MNIELFLPITKGMSLRIKFNRAAFIIENLHPDHARRLKQICHDIQNAQEALRHSAGPLLAKCINGCEGLCCRNIQPDEIISLWDCIFILGAGNIEPAQIADHLDQEVPLFRSDCIFLSDGIGPCIFPANTRPEVCLASFCTDASSVKKEVGRLKWQFLRINRLILLNQPGGLLRSLWNARRDSFA